jgi:hypothetical protein
MRLKRLRQDDRGASECCSEVTIGIGKKVVGFVIKFGGTGETGGIR